MYMFPRSRYPCNEFWAARWVSTGLGCSARSPRRGRVGGLLSSPLVLGWGHFTDPYHCTQTQQTASTIELQTALFLFSDSPTPRKNQTNGFEPWTEHSNCQLGKGKVGRQATAAGHPPRRAHGTDDQQVRAPCGLWPVGVGHTPMAARGSGQPRVHSGRVHTACRRRPAATSDPPAAGSVHRSPPALCALQCRRSAALAPGQEYAVVGLHGDAQV